MKKAFKLFLLLLLITLAENLQAQNSPMFYQCWNIMDVNKVRTKFNNTGLLCDGNEQNVPLARPPCFEYPNGSGIDYGVSVGIVIGSPANQDTGAVGGTDVQNLEYLDGTMSEGSSDFWDPEHFAPYSEVVGSTKAPLSTDKTTWPTKGPNRGWPANIPGTNQPLLVGSEGWPGLGKNGERLADQETYSVMYAFQGAKIQVAQSDRRWLRTHMEMHGMAWTGELYQDFIIWVFVIRNIGTAPITGMRVGINSAFGYLPWWNSPTQTSNACRYYYEPRLQLGWGCSDKGYATSPAGISLVPGQVAFGGIVVLRMPGPTKRVKTWDAFHYWINESTPSGNGANKECYYRWNLSNQDDPRDSDKDGIDDDFDTPGNTSGTQISDGVPDTLEGLGGYYLSPDADGIETIGSGPFTFAPGDTDTLIFATVFGMTKDQLYKNANNARALYSSGWQVISAPTPPRVEIIAQDTKNTIYWSTESERVTKFEGYKLYRSVDNGVTWGTSSFTDFSGTTRYIPLQQWDKIDSIQGHYTTMPEYAWFNLGSETGLPTLKVLTGNEGTSYFKAGDTVRVYVDNNGVIDGQKYRYCVASYDTGNAPITGPLENTPSPNPMVGSNTVEVVPHAPMSVGTLSKVKVVPNPYIVASGWEVGPEKQIQFTHLPSKATIKIFNVAGELIKTIYHDSGTALAESIETWDLLNESKQLVAAGLYFYYIDSPIGKTTGKFIIIQ
jgi:hypothetical protein